MQTHKVAPKDTMLSQSVVFDCFAQLHIIHYLQAKRFVGSYLVVSITANKIKRPRSHMISGIGILHLPGALPKREHRLDRAEHHLLTKSLHDERGKDHKMICAGTLGISYCPAQRIGPKEDIAVGK